MKLLEQEIETGVTTDLKLVLHNDDVNPIQRVIILLVMIMGYDTARAEQLATIAHHKGKVCIKEGGNLDYLLQVKGALNNENLTVTLE